MAYDMLRSTLTPLGSTGTYPYLRYFVTWIYCTSIDPLSYLSVYTHVLCSSDCLDPCDIQHRILAHGPVPASSTLRSLTRLHLESIYFPPSVALVSYTNFLSR